jgi:hypothetical protein
LLKPRKAKAFSRVALGLAAVAVVGALIGAAAEEVSYRGAVREDERVMTSQTPEAATERAEDPRDVEVVRRATEGLPPYGDAAPKPLAADYLGAQAPIAAAWFETQDGPEAVLRFYRKALLDRGLPVMEDRTGPSSGYVGYKDPRTHAVHLITAVGEAGRTRVFVSNAVVESLRTGVARLPAGLPAPEGMETPMVMTFRREGAVESSVVSAIPGASVERLLAFYEKALGEGGFTVDSAQRENGEATIATHRERSHGLIRLRHQQTDAVELYVQWVAPE